MFIDGEFWRGYQGVKNENQIKTNRALWIPKIERKMQNDRIADRQLQGLGYFVFRFWTEEVKKKSKCLCKPGDVIYRNRKRNQNVLL